MQSDVYPSRNGQPAHLTDRIDPVVYAKDRAGAPVKREQIDAYERDGFLVLHDVFSPEEVARLQAEQDRMRHDDAIRNSPETITEFSSLDVRSIFRVHKVSPVFERLASDPRLADLARYILDDEVYIHQSRLNYKPGFRGKEFYWHSDFETWHVEDGMPRMRALSMSITLTENFHHNGPLMLVPGSQRRYAVCAGHTPENHHLVSLKKQEYGVPSDDCLDQMVREGGIVTALGKPGSVIVFDCNTMHGSNGNITPDPRSNAFFVYNAVSNRVQSPYSGQAPRPEHICTRESFEVLAREELANA
ncbi:ectoine hydroxylase [Hydrogenophaga sp. 5NK40-0174]|uniref:ectoine hydroxylase n=1 Tax=Hydrogenophaga sp. 5NK40-0174 TaxID=3127649 RepID=UPI0033404342